MKLPSLLRRLLPWFIVIALAVFVIYKLKFTPVPVVAHTVAKGTVIGEVMGTGTLEARVKTTISPRIQERLVEVLVDQGDTVKSGQLLAWLDDAEVKQQVAIAEATLAATKQTTVRVNADLPRAEAKLALAKRDDNRLAGLAAAKAVSQSDADKAAEILRVSEADLTRSNAAIAEAQGLVLVAEKTLLYRKEQMAFTEIHAPYDGLIIRRDHDPGDMLVPGSSLIEIISLDEIWVSAWVDETAIPAVDAEQPARIVFRSEGDKSYPGVVSRIGRETDRETREFLVDVRVNELPKNWTIGQRAEVFIETGHAAEVIVLPQELLVWKDKRAGVFVPADGKAQWREVTLGLLGSQQVEIKTGLSVGEIVIRHKDSPKTELKDGLRIAMP
jgi:HlyD family secretion protein